MLKEHRFLVSYIINNQPQSTEVCVEADSLTAEEARIYIEAKHRVDVSDVITDIQVMSIHHAKKPGHHPGHYVQPED